MKKITLPGFTLIEVAIVIAIFGILAGTIMKGISILETAKIYSTKQDFEKYRYAILSYQDQFNALPGDDKDAHARFGVQSGNGNGVIDETERENVWGCLYKAGLISFSATPKSKVGGEFYIVHNPEDLSGHYIALSNKDGTGALTPEKAQKLQGDLIIKNGKGQNGCVNSDGVINLQNKDTVCCAYLPF